MNNELRNMLAIPSGIFALIIIVNLLYLQEETIFPNGSITALLTGVFGSVGHLYTAFKVAPRDISKSLERSILTIAILMGLVTMTIGGIQQEDIHHLSSFGGGLLLTSIIFAVKRRNQRRS